MSWRIRKTEFAHYGIKGMRWGVRRTPEQLGHKRSLSSAKKLSSKMQREISYDEFRGLRIHSDVVKSRKGDCHSQVMYEYEELKRAGYNPKAKFFIEVNPDTGQGGQTHSFVYFKDNGSFVWFENAWGGQEGLHLYSTEEEMIKDIETRHRSEQYGDSKHFSELVWGPFIPENHSRGETLQELVDTVMKDEERGVRRD